jgi:phospholipid transport system substrate-binding protein
MMHPSPDTVRATLPRAAVAAALLAAALLVPAAPAAAVAPAARLAPAARQAADGARALIQDTADKVIALLKDPALDSHTRREKIIELVDGRIDVIVVCKLVLAKNYSRFTPAQVEEFRKQFREHLIATYYRNAEAARFSSIEILESREEERGDWTVRSKVVSKEQGDTFIDYRLRKSKDTGQWLIIDITIENVSLVQNFRSQFQEVLSNKEPAQLLELLREKNRKAELDDRATDNAVDAAGNGESGGKPKPADGSDGAGGNSVKGGGNPQGGADSEGTR